MTIKYHIHPEARDKLQRQAVSHIQPTIQSFICFYERWPTRAAEFFVVENDLLKNNSLFHLIQQDEQLKGYWDEVYEDVGSGCEKASLIPGWPGVYNLCIPLVGEMKRHITLVGGNLCIIEKEAEAKKAFAQFLETIPPSKQMPFKLAWQRVPRIKQSEAFSYLMRELEFVGRSYLNAIEQRGDVEHRIDQANHDISNALQILIADIEILKIEMKESFNIGRKWENEFEKIIHVCEQHNRYLKQVMNADEGKYTYESINKIIQQALKPYKAKAQTRRIEFRVELEKDLDDHGNYQIIAVRLDRVTFRQALRNLFDNAVKYSFSGTTERTRWVDVIGRRYTINNIPGYQLTITNFGIGIENDEIALIFEAGYQGRRRLNEERVGYGMGLTFVKECIEKHAGHIAMRSTPQKGTGWLNVVEIWLPLQGPTYQSR